ncbi:hypothetical protein LOTGIDRAFT_166737 [Lottia gigantea]|uniref:Ionotropic glutamate receptor C-terminal domain-containing protein n=1 Tax=Lottia gigantea TaxID=225164 RepID=V3ZRN6_LOTGI|nr:hypothetical protein LOTGIDRAFT_166737 [Lottia gigantea]ESO87002.1 hypothetical protein LOTGIDRAFT_166737 [Lottia gigantea]
MDSNVSTATFQFAVNAQNFVDPVSNCRESLVEFAVNVYHDCNVNSVIIVGDAELSESSFQLSDGNLFIIDYVFKNAENCSGNYNILYEVFNDVYHGREELNVLIVLGNTQGIDLRVMRCLIQGTEHVFQIRTRWMVVSANIKILNTLLEAGQLNVLPNLSVVTRTTDACIPKIFTKVEHPYQTTFDEVSNGELSIDKVFPNFKYRMNGRHLNVSTISQPNPLQLPFQLLQVISRYLNFSYTLTEPRDLTYGAIVNGSWRGMVGQLVKKEASLVFARLTENLERQKVVDFIYPNLEIAKTGIVFRKEREEPSWLLFWRPFGTEVYLGIVTSYVCISILLIVSTGFFTKGVSLCNTVLDILLFTAGCLFLEGGHVHFKNNSKMLIWASWWLFCVVMGGLYTAMLTKVFIPKETKPFNGISQLLDRTDWKYGTMDQSFHTDMMINSKNKQLKDLWTNMMRIRESNPNILSPDLNIQTKLVLSGKYAFLNGAVDNYLSFLKNCDLDFIKFKEFPDSFHSLAVAKGSILKIDMEDAMRRLKYSGIYDHITHEGDLSRICKFDNSVKPLSMSDVKGLLLPLVIGILAAALVLILEKACAFCLDLIRS